jgi:superfamily II DNA or RNA helicase
VFRGFARNTLARNRDHDSAACAFAARKASPLGFGAKARASSQSLAGRFASTSVTTGWSTMTTSIQHPVCLLGNAHAQILHADPGLLELVRYDMAYAAQDGFTATIDDGWDGHLRLLSKDGHMPAGLVSEACRLFAKYGTQLRVVDTRTRPATELPLWSPTIKLRPYQAQLVEAALAAERGVLDAPPRSGKTVMLAAIVDKLNLPTLWIAPTKAIVHQTWLALQRDLGPSLSPAAIQEVTGGWPKTTHDEHGDRRENQASLREDEIFAAKVVVTTAASAVKFPQSFYDTRNILILDEYHHAAALSYHRINDLAHNIYYRYGATGTHFRSDTNTEILMDAVLANVVAKIHVQDLVEQGYLCPVDVVFAPITAPVLGPQSLPSAYRWGVERHHGRNSWAAWAAQALLATGKRVIVLVEHIDHGITLSEMIPDAVFVRGADGKAVKDEDVFAAIQAFNRGEHRCLVGTSVLGEGVDLPALVYAKGGSASVTVTQDVFRVLTASEGKRRAIVVDFADRHQEALCAQSAKRGEIYAREEAFSIEVLSSAADLPAWLATRT